MPADGPGSPRDRSHISRPGPISRPRHHVPPMACGKTFLKVGGLCGSAGTKRDQTGDRDGKDHAHDAFLNDAPSLRWWNASSAHRFFVIGMASGFRRSKVLARAPQCSSNVAARNCVHLRKESDNRMNINWFLKIDSACGHMPRKAPSLWCDTLKPPTLTHRDQGLDSPRCSKHC